ncbi:MAG: ABC transporter substrate-binding protein, partial [Actinomycetes bacterium]
RGRRVPRAVAVLVVVALAGAAVGLIGPGSAGAAVGPKSGGAITFGLEAETTSGWCLPQSQLAASGIEVAGAIYDPLTVINAKKAYVPYLAKSLTPNATFDQWTIALRPGVTFHDGTPVDAAAVKFNLDSWRGANPRLPARLLQFVFANVADVTVVDPLTVSVTTKTPWPSFPAQIAGARFGITAPAQLDNPDTCATNLIGSGPFQLQSWRVNESLVVTRNPHYWRTGLPYLDQITFRPITDATSAMNQFLGGALDVFHTTNISDIVALKADAAAGKATVIEQSSGAEVAYVMYNSSKPPFNDLLARQAVVLARNTAQVNQIRNRGLPPLASGPFSPGSVGWLADNGTPKPDLKKAKALVAEYTAKYGAPPNYEYLTTTDPNNVAIAELVKGQSAKVGIEVSIRTVDQSALINDALAGNFQAMSFRNHPGGDPDTQYVWWKSTSPLNFGRIKDPEIDRLLDAGRVEADPAKRTAIYEDLNRRFADQAWDLWSWFTLWTIGAQTSVKGVAGPPLPDGGGKPFAGFGGVVPVVGMWRSGR